MASPDSQMEISQRDTLGGLARSLMHQLRVSMFTALPGEVITWTEPDLVAEKPAFVQVKLHIKYEVQLKDGTIESAEYPPLPNVPVAYSGLSGLYLRGPLEPGEVGIVLFSMRGLDLWKNKGGPVDAVDQTICDINNGMFIPGIRHGSIAQFISPDSYVLGAEDGSYKLEIDKATKDLTLTTQGPNIRIESAAEVTVEAPSVKLGANATLGNARLNDPVSANAALTTFISQVSGLFNTPGPMVGAPGSVTKPGPVIGTISSASTKVSSE